MAAQTIYTEEETRSLINTRARESGGDNFRIKIHRRPSMGGFLIHVATLTDARAEHITYTETWLPRLCGGGTFALGVYPNDAPNQQIGGFLNVNFDGSIKPVNPMLVREPDWGGPSGIAFPDFPPAQVQVITHGAGGQNSHVSAANPTVPGNGPPQPQTQQGPEWERLLARERELQDRERKMRDELMSESARLREERLRAEMQSKISELHVANAQANAQRPQSDNGPEKLLTAAAPIITQMMQMQNESRMLALKMQQDSQALMIQMQKDSQARTDELFKLIMSSKDNSGNGSAEMMGRMVEAMGAISKTSVSMIEAVAEIQFQNAPTEHPGLIAIREFGKAIRAVSSGTQEGARRVAQGQQQRGLPTNGSRPPPGYEQQARAQPPQPHQPPQSKLLTPQPPPQKQQRPAAQAFGDMAKQGPVGHGTTEQNPAEPNPLIGIAEMIKRYEDPNEVATHFIHSLSNPEVQAAIEEADSSIKNLAVEMLGMEWIVSDERNEGYLREVFEAINRLGTEAGIFEEDGDDEDEGEEGEDGNGSDEAADEEEAEAG